MRAVFTEELDNLFDDLTRLGNAANESLHKVMKAYNEDDKELAHELFSDDLRINALTIDIESDAYRIIALQQPVARDLRKVFTVLQASTDIERLADHCVQIGRNVINRDEEHANVEEIDQRINRMAEVVGEMLTDVLVAINERDTNQAREIAARDNEVDELLTQVIHEATKRMEMNTEVVNVGVAYIQIAGSLERIGDYITNICERIVYLNTGSILELN